MQRISWWRRNRLWLALLLPLLALALAASSFRLSNLYLRWEWNQPVVVHGSGVYTQNYQDTRNNQRTRTAKVGIAQLARTTVVAADHPAPGTELWRIDLDFEAAPDQFLAGCTIEFEDAAGVRYGTQGAKVDASGRPNPLPRRPECVPSDAPGPELDWFGELVSPSVPRPGTWKVVASVAMPEGVRPTAVRVLWDKPGYLKLVIPS